MLNLYSIYDSVSETFAPPFTAAIDGVAYRMFSDEVNRADPSNMLNSHYLDYSLHCLGAFLPETGEIVPSATRLLVAEGSKVKL